jgi:hypothetical protein
MVDVMFITSASAAVSRGQLKSGDSLMPPEYTGEWVERASAHEGRQSPSSSETFLARAS